jgi:hypothetical protein
MVFDPLLSGVCRCSDWFQARSCRCRRPPHSDEPRQKLSSMAMWTAVLGRLGVGPPPVWLRNVQSSGVDGIASGPDLDRPALRQAGAMRVQCRREIFEKPPRLLVLSRMPRVRTDVREAELLQDLAIVRSWQTTPKRSATICRRSAPASARPCTAQSGSRPDQTAPAAPPRGAEGLPFDQLSLSPSGPLSLKRCTQSRSVWRSIRSAPGSAHPVQHRRDDDRRRL